MATAEHLPTQDVLAEKYDTAYAARLIVYSFFFSQGNERFQRPILQYLATRYNDRFDTDTIRDAILPASKMVFAIRQKYHLHKPVEDRYTGEEMPVTEEEAENQVSGFAKDLSSYIADGKEINEEELDLAYLIHETIDRDIFHLGSHPNTGGRRREPSDTNSPYADNHLSLWVYFGLLGQTTGMPEYDKMFEEMVSDYYESTEPGSEYEKKSSGLINYHLYHHPDQLHLLPDHLKPVVV